MARILVIDDESNIRMMLRIALQHAGHAVVTAADGPEGLERFGAGESWDLVLLDQRMPGMEGLEVLSEIRIRDPHASVILITAYGTIDLALEAAKAGASDFLRKPFTADILRGAVDSVLRGQGQQQPAGLTTINGFRIIPNPEPATNQASQSSFVVEGPGGERSECIVAIAPNLLAEIEQRSGGGNRAELDRISNTIRADALANYIWQNSEGLAEGILRVDELSGSARRRVGLD